MAGHHQWSKVKRLNRALHPKRGKLFTKLAGQTLLGASAGEIFRPRDRNPARNDAEPFHFKRIGALAVSRIAADEAPALEAMLELRASDADRVTAAIQAHLISTPHGQLVAVGDSLKRAGLDSRACKLTCLPENAVPSRTKRQRWKSSGSPMRSKTMRTSDRDIRTLTFPKNSR